LGQFGNGFSPIELFRLGLFLGAITLAYWLTLRWCIEWARGTVPRSPFARFFQRGVIGVPLIGLAILGVVCMGYGFLVEPGRLAVKTYRIDTRKIPAGEQVRIVHLADLHVRGTGPRERRLPELVQSLAPDVILHSGDFFARKHELEPVVVELLRSWDTPQFTCKGNLDILADFDRAMKEAGVRALNGDSVTETFGTARLTITGFPSGADHLMPEVLRGLPSDTFNIVLYHHPQGFPKTWNTPVDLMLAGHTHGGQVRLPWYGALVTLDRYGKRWESGFYEENGVKLIVSRGLGCEPFAPEVRFLCAPEVIVIDLVGTG